MNASRATTFISAGTLFLSACATQATLGPLHEAQLSCAVQHNAQACSAVPLLQANANEEANHNGWLAAGLILLLPLAVLAAGADAHDDDYVYVRHCHRCY
jgi:hypothetical protein